MKVCIPLGPGLFCEFACFSCVCGFGAGPEASSQHPKDAFGDRWSNSCIIQSLSSALLVSEKSFTGLSHFCCCVFEAVFFKHKVINSNLYLNFMLSSRLTLIRQLSRWRSLKFAVGWRALSLPQKRIWQFMRLRIYSIKRKNTQGCEESSSTATRQIYEAQIRIKICKLILWRKVFIHIKSVFHWWKRWKHKTWHTHANVFWEGCQTGCWWSRWVWPLLLWEGNVKWPPFHRDGENYPETHPDKYLRCWAGVIFHWHDNASQLRQCR